MNILDWGVLALLFASVLLGFLRGGVREVLGLGGLIGGLVFAFLGAPLLAPLLSDVIASPNLAWAAAFVIIFIAIRIVAWGLGKLLTEVLRASKLGGFDKLLGLLFGAFRAVVLVLIVAYLSMLTRLPTTPLWLGSTVAPRAQQAVNALTPFLPADAQRWISK